MRHLAGRVTAVCLALLTLMAGRADAQPQLTIDVASRSLQLGELVVLTMTIDQTPERMRVSVFDRTITAFRMDDGRWRALVGVDLDQRAGRYQAIVEAFVDASISAAPVRAATELVVVRRLFPTRTLRVEPDFVNPSPALLNRIAEEQKFTRSVYAQSLAERQWRGPFVRPVPQAANSRFGTRSVFNGERRSPHAGTDFLSPAGQPIKAPNAGRIVAARDLFYTGNTVIIDHGLGLFSMMAHMSRLDVREGDQVASGQVLGLVGATGRVTGPHLHWALSVSGARVDPLSLLALLGDGVRASVTSP